MDSREKKRKGSREMERESLVLDLYRGREDSEA